MKKGLLIGTILFLLLTIGFASIYTVSSKDESTNVSSDATSTSTPISTMGEEFKSRELPDGYREFQSEKFQFSLFLPEDFTVKTYDEKEGATTLVFADALGERGFQIYITPYVADTITENRLRYDIPSGTYTTPIEIVLADGTHALAFFSSGITGDMREIWFIHHKYLYEVSTYKELDNWLADIMKTWEFL